MFYGQASCLPTLIVIVSGGLVVELLAFRAQNKTSTAAKDTTLLSRNHTVGKGNENKVLEVSAAFCIQMLVFWSVNLFGPSKLIFEIKKWVSCCFLPQRNMPVFTIWFYYVPLRRNGVRRTDGCLVIIPYMHETILCAITNERLGVASSVR